MIRYMTNLISTEDESAAAPTPNVITPNTDDIIKALASSALREILGGLKDPAGQFPPQVYPFEMGVCAGKIYDKAGLS